jgi:hypothetical protein
VTVEVEVEVDFAKAQCDEVAASNQKEGHSRGANLQWAAAKKADHEATHRSRARMTSENAQSTKVNLQVAKVGKALSRLSRAISRHILSRRRPSLLYVQIRADPEAERLQSAPLRARNLRIQLARKACLPHVKLGADPEAGKHPVLQGALSSARKVHRQFVKRECALGAEKRLYLQLIRRKATLAGKQVCLQFVSTECGIVRLLPVQVAADLQLLVAEVHQQAP